MLVTVGGGADTLTGGAGLDSFWADSTDTVTDAEAAETAVAAVHRITQFYQPYTTDTTSPQYVPMTISGQSLADPTAGYAYRNFASVPLFNGGPNYTDVAQGALGDCYYLASLASLADTDPALVKQMIAPLGDGTFAVRFYRNGQEVYLRLDADLPSPGQFASLRPPRAGQRVVGAADGEGLRLLPLRAEQLQLDRGRLDDHGQSGVDRQIVGDDVDRRGGPDVLQLHQQPVGSRARGDAGQQVEHIRPDRRQPCLHGQERVQRRRG